MTNLEYTAPLVKAELLAALPLRPGLKGVSVTWGLPVAIPAADWVWLGDIRGEQSVRSLNRMTQPRAEDYDLDVTIRVIAGPDEQAEATTRAYAIASEIVGFTRDDPTLANVPGIVAVTTSGPVTLEETAIKTPSGRQALLRITLACSARI